MPRRGSRRDRHHRLRVPRIRLRGSAGGIAPRRCGGASVKRTRPARRLGAAARAPDRMATTRRAGAFRRTAAALSLPIPVAHGTGVSAAMEVAGLPEGADFDEPHIRLQLLACMIPEELKRRSGRTGSSKACATSIRAKYQASSGRRKACSVLGAMPMQAWPTAPNMYGVNPGVSDRELHYPAVPPDTLRRPGAFRPAFAPPRPRNCP